MSAPVLPVNDWNAVEISVLDENKQYLFSFGDEFWHETGYDEGRWDESKVDVGIRAHFEKAGDYYLSIESETNAQKPKGQYSVTVWQQRGSTVAFEWLKWISLVVGSFVVVYQFKDEIEVTT
jgi:hypothetical protein